jgi:hypothetical protein
MGSCEVCTILKNNPQNTDSEYRTFSNIVPHIRRASPFRLATLIAPRLLQSVHVAHRSYYAVRCSNCLCFCAYISRHARQLNLGKPAHPVSTCFRTSSILSNHPCNQPNTNEDLEDLLNTPEHLRSLARSADRAGQETRTAFESPKRRRRVRAFDSDDENHAPAGHVLGLPVRRQLFPLPRRRDQPSAPPGPSSTPLSYNQHEENQRVDTGHNDDDDEVRSNSIITFGLLIDS